MKKTAIVIGALIASLTITPAQAVESPTVAIIDSGFNPSLIKNVVGEVCILVTKTGCNNGTGFDQSVGASNTNITLRANWKSEWDHGTKMASIVNQVNPDAKILLIRNAIVVPTGAVNIGGEAEFAKSLKWVISNKTKYNISAVSFSRGQQTWVKKGVCPVNKDIQADIISLQNLGVATVIAAGNNGDKTNINYPACIPEAVAISGIYSSSYTPKIWSSYNQTFGTNSGLLTDFFTYGNFNTVLGPVAESTSASTASFAGYWSKVTNGSYFETYEKLSKSTSNKYIDVLK